MTTKYSLNIRHNGTDCGDFCIYQTKDNQEDVRQLVWWQESDREQKRPDIGEATAKQDENK